MINLLKKLLLIFIFLIAFIKVNSQHYYYKMPAGIADSDYLAKTIVFEIKPEYRTKCNAKDIKIQKLNTFFNSIGATNVLKKFPNKTPPVQKYNKYGAELVDLSLIYMLNYSKDIPLETAINKLLSTGIVEYAEPYFIPHLLFVPDDPFADTTNGNFCQWHLKKIKAYQAWDIEKGDTNIVIGITDTGIDLLHPDLAGNIKINYADPINGIDDDGDGFKDNYYGWDLADNDSCPSYWQGHGVHVAGLSSAITNNSIGAAGVGYKCKFLPIKIQQSVTGAIVMAYESIVYAVDHGCSIVNCSWGGGGGGSEYGQSIINYAVNNMNAVVVAACGNSNSSSPIYPAAYDNVLSVAATDINDCKWSGSSYGTTVDIAAPGQDIYSTWIGGKYVRSSGTSMATPIVSGAAAIVKAHFPSYTSAQIVARLRSSADIIDTIPANTAYKEMLGSGRLNLYKALTNKSPWISMVSKIMTDNNDNSIIGGDTLRIVGTFKNLLDTSTNQLRATLSCSSNYVTILDSSTTLGEIYTMATANNADDPFEILISPDIPFSTQLDFKITYSDPAFNYKSVQYFSIIVNIDFMDIKINELGTTVTSHGKIGYNNQETYSQGLGFRYKNSGSYLACGGFIVGNSGSNVSDDLYGEIAGSYDHDFNTVKVIHNIPPFNNADFASETIYTDSGATNPLNITIKNRSYAWKLPPNDKFVILEYTIKNHGIQTLSTLYAGIYMDFDMNSDSVMLDKVNYDETNKMGYTYNVSGGTYAAIKLLSQDAAHHYAFDNDGHFNGSTDSKNVDDGFTGYEKYFALKTNINRNIAGTSEYGNNVSDMISTGPFVLLSGDSVKVCFALIAGDHLADIQASAVAADQLYNHVGIKESSLQNTLQLSDVFPNPVNNAASVDINIPATSEIEICIFDMNGKKILTLAQGKSQQGFHEYKFSTEKLPAGIYQIRLNDEKSSISKTFSLIK